MSEFDLVIFDCDGVLIDSEIISARMLVAELARLGLEIDLTYVERNVLGRSYPVVMETIRREFGLDLPPDTSIRVVDSTADIRYLVLPMRPEGTDALSEDALAALVGRDSLIGVARAGAPLKR